MGPPSFFSAGSRRVRNFARMARLATAATKCPPSGCGSKGDPASGRVPKSVPISASHSNFAAKLSKFARQFPGQKPVDGERIPALAELFELVRRSGKTVRLNIETKLSLTSI